MMLRDIALAAYHSVRHPQGCHWVAWEDGGADEEEPAWRVCIGLTRGKAPLTDPMVARLDLEVLPLGGSPVIAARWTSEEIEPPIHAWVYTDDESAIAKVVKLLKCPIYFRR